MIVGIGNSSGDKSLTFIDVFEVLHLPATVTQGLLGELFTLEVFRITEIPSCVDICSFRSSWIILFTDFNSSSSSFSLYWYSMQEAQLDL
jgi:hypothetical protein